MTTQYLVRYKVDMGEGPKSRMAGPYKSYDEAETHRLDIKGYDRVSAVYLDWYEEEPQCV